jgi:hypothetical protein
MLLEILDALHRSPPGQLLSTSTPAFAATEALHLLGIALLGGAVITLDLAVLGLIFRNGDLQKLARDLFRIFWIGLGTMAVSGVLLVASGPYKYLTNPLFGPKLAVLAIALLVHVLLYPVALTKQLKYSRALAGGSLALWITVAIIGRWVGLI